MKLVSSVSELRVVMSKVARCPTCNGKAKIKENVQSGEVIYLAIEDEAAFKKIGQLKRAMAKAVERVKMLEKEIETLKGKYQP